MALRRPTREELRIALDRARRELVALRERRPADAERVREVEGAVRALERQTEQQGEQARGT